LIHNEKKTIVLFEKTVICLRSQRPLQMQGHHGKWGCGHKKNNCKKWKGKEEERHKGLLTKKQKQFLLTYIL
jgi:hypothetical protein